MTKALNESNFEDAVSKVANWLSVAKSAIAFTGAGISTESGIPDFRSPGGIWSQSKPVYFDEFLRSEESRHEYWRQKSISHRDFADAQPNDGHTLLAGWEQQGRLRAVITQNIDGLHSLAGSKQVLELHGTARSVACLECGNRFDAEVMVAKFRAEDQVPKCDACGGITKHATISFGQPLPPDLLQKAIQLSKQADVFLAMGSSLVVEPAASLPRYAKQHGARLIIINRDPTPQDSQADVVIHASIGHTVQAIDRQMTRVARE